jgi:hypothetical protein
MGPWKSHFELVIPNRTPAQIATAAREQGGSRMRVGLILRVQEDRIRARYNEMSRSSTAPLLKGRLVSEEAGTRIIGDIQWTNVVVGPFATLCVALGALAGGSVLIAGGNRLVGAVFLVICLFFLFLTVIGFRGDGVGRNYEQDRLRKELLKRLDGKRQS